MKLTDCEVTHRVVRGHNVAFVYGDRRASDAELQELATEWEETRGPGLLPAYVSPDGWQALPAVSEVSEQAEEADSESTNQAAPVKRGSKPRGG